MPTLTWNEIRNRAVTFAADWGDETSERAEAQTFRNEFLDVFGVKRRRVAVYEKRVATLTKNAGRIDRFWPGVMLAEHIRPWTARSMPPTFPMAARRPTPAMPSAWPSCFVDMPR